MHVEGLPRSRPVCVPILVLIVKAVFLLQRGHTQTHTDKVTGVTDEPIRSSATAGVGSDAEHVTSVACSRASDVTLAMASDQLTIRWLVG